MAQKSNWIDNDDDYWSESKSNAFDFDDEDSIVTILKSESNEAKQSVASFRKIDNSNQSVINSYNKSLDLKLSNNLAEKQIQNCLNILQIEEKNQLSQKVLTKISPKEVIECLVKGIEVYLNCYKGKEEKLALLDSAIDSNDGNAIITVVLFLKQTLKAGIFNYELSRRALAADHYIYYLKQKEQINELMDVLAMLGRHEEAAVMAYMQAISSRTPETRIKNLTTCLQSHFTTGGSNITFWNSFIAEQIDLLLIQSPIETDDIRNERQETNPMFQQIPRSPLINLPVITTLYYCCLYHYSIPETLLANPTAISKKFHLSQKQYVWTALSALAKCNRWQQIDALFEYKSWLGSKKIKSCIPFEKILQILKKNNAPQELLERYIEQIDDNEVKFNLAKEMKLTKVAIDILIKTRDRKRLEELGSKLVSDSHEYSYVQNALRATTVKWKN